MQGEELKKFSEQLKLDMKKTIEHEKEMRKEDLIRFKEEKD